MGKHERNRKGLLNGFHWSEKLIAWQDLLKLLEGHALHIAAPTTHFTKDLVMDKNISMFATPISRIRYYTNGRINELETEMIQVRWKTFSFYRQLLQIKIKELESYPKCSANFVLALTRKQPLRDVPKNRCLFFPGDIHNDVNPRTLLIQNMEFITLL